MRRAWSIAAGPALALMAIGVFWGAFTAWLPDIKERAGASDGVMGLVLLGSAAGGIFGMALFPRLSRAFGAMLLPTAAIVLAAATFLQLMGQGPIGLFLALAGMGMAMSVLDVAANVRLSMLEVRHDQPLMNLAHGLYSLGYAVAAALAGLARGAGIMQWVIVAVVAAAILAIAPRLRAPLEAAERPGAAERTPWAAALPAALILFAAFLAENATETWSALHIERTLNAPRGEGAFGPAMLGFTMAAGRLGGQMAAMRIGEARLIVLSTLIGIAGAVLLAAAPSQSLAIAAVALIGIGCAVIVPSANALLGRAVRPEQRPLAISRAWMIGFSGFFIGPVLMGWIAEGAGLRAGFLAVAVILALILPGLARLRR